MNERDTQLFGILKIAHEQSLRGAGLSLVDAMDRADYESLRAGFKPRHLLPLIKKHPEFIDDWILYCEDKRCGGWYLTEEAVIGRISPEKGW